MFGKLSIILNVGTLFVGEDIMSDVLFLGITFTGVTLIYDFEWLVEDLEFIKKYEW